MIRANDKNVTTPSESIRVHHHHPWLNRNFKKLSSFKNNYITQYIHIYYKIQSTISSTVGKILIQTTSAKQYSRWKIIKHINSHPESWCNRLQFFDRICKIYIFLRLGNVELTEIASVIL